RLAIKLLNASKFVLGIASAGPPPGPDGLGQTISSPLDRAMLQRLGRLIEEATAAYVDYDYARALERTEAFFWSFCDDHLELVKARAYGALGEEGAASARAALDLALSALLRLFAPVMPFVTEEVWSWWRKGSVHRAPWPAVAELGDLPGDEALSDLAARVLGKIRAAKSERKLSMRAPVARVVIRDVEDRLSLLRSVEGDLREAGSVADLRFEAAGAGAELEVDVELAG
ncbi:MAG TPA: class I tRNA ligase family protein, partial [Acidimicrobiales bacterium]|nr:class I tRNA ligase family protein [Acidimicrobiales bacterium]